MIDISGVGTFARELAAIGGLAVGIFWVCSQAIFVKNKLDEHDNCIKESKEERKLTIELQRTILEVVARNKNNGNVEEAMEKIDKFLDEKAHK
jgi:hypothetical protein